MCPFCGCSKDAFLSCLSSCCMWHSIAWKAPSQHPILTLKKGHLQDGLEIVDLWIFEVNEKGYTRKYWHKEFKFKTDERAGTFQPKSRSALFFFFFSYIYSSQLRRVKNSNRILSYSHVRRCNPEHTPYAAIWSKNISDLQSYYTLMLTKAH